MKDEENLDVVERGSVGRSVCLYCFFVYLLVFLICLPASSVLFLSIYSSVFLSLFPLILCYVSRGCFVNGRGKGADDRSFFFLAI